MWFDLLLAARKMRHPFTVEQFDRVVGFAATEKSTSRNIASAWVGKLVKWGYLKPVGKVGRKTSFAGGRPHVLYEVTDWGNKKEAPKRKYWQPFDGMEKP